ncbi:unnamed protein product [Blepharisma stoltei]|uniref:Uncharacterized protein n=1 Tax=Blepharisma stoltei TaxID=1481888 RepID=A0AAU9IG35_9CILI|nr:unnamed protein product [Blepharisma stoltei]
MVNSLLKSLSILQVSCSKNEFSHSSLISLIENVETEPIAENPFKVAINLSFLEEIANIANKLASEDAVLYNHLVIIECGIQEFLRHWKGVSNIQNDLKSIRQNIVENSKIINSQMKRVSRILKDYRDRCRNSFLEYLKSLDLDVRRILKPLVPTSVVLEQVKFPLINENPSLRSSVAASQPESARESVSQQSPREDLETLPSSNPAENTIDKLNNHIQMLVGTLEKVAKELIQIVAESDRQYYEILNKVEVYSRPPTPLAAPLPEYFCFDTEESKENLKPEKHVFPKKTKAKWRERLKLLYTQNNINESTYVKLLKKVNLADDNDGKIDLEELFKDTDISMDVKENAAFCLVNTSKIPQQDVSLIDLMLIEEDAAKSIGNGILSENVKPEPPKEPKPKNRPIHKIEKQVIESKPKSPNPSFLDFSPQKVDKDRLSPVPRINQVRKSIPSTKPYSKFIAQKQQNESSFNIERKDVRVRSITPVGKPKFKFDRKKRTKTPSGFMPYSNLNSFSIIH